MCEAPEVPENTTVQLFHGDAQNGIVAVFQCLRGYQFSDGTTVRTWFCIDGIWVTPMQQLQCTGMFTKST